MNDTQPASAPHRPPLGVAGRVAATFINSKLTPLLLVASVLLGIAAVLLLPREEEPQIRVPMIDVMVAMPGFSAKEVEERATRPMEKLLWEIPGVEYIYSTSRPGQSLVIVRFRVGEDVERSLVKLNQKLASNFDRIPPGVSNPLIKPRSIDDVPILALTLHSRRYDHLTLRRVAAQLDEAIKQIPNVAETTIIGGARRAIRILLDPERLTARQLSLLSVARPLQQANRQLVAGTISTANREIQIEAGEFLDCVQSAASLVVGTFNGRPVYLRDVADVVDGAEEPSQYVLFGEPGTDEQPAVTLTVAKRPGANAIVVAKQVLKKIEHLKGVEIPEDIDVTVTRNYGETAAEKSNELLFHMLLAVISVSFLILLILGWREAGIVAIAIPSTLALTLLAFYLGGYTLNRITLFALIFSIGILVDDAIVVVENVVRHFRMPENHGRNRTQVAIEAVNEVGNPTILATLAVIAAVLPMAFVGGLMGPYMRPIPVGASAAMAVSLAIAFIITPWAAIRILGRGHTARSHSGHAPAREDLLTRLYRRAMGPLIARRLWRWGFLASITVLLGLSFAGVPFGWVKLKMLPFDNKSEFQVILNMPEGSTLEETARAARAMAAAIRHEPEVLNYQAYIGTAAPFNFNGLVRHYFLRRGPHIADLQINLAPKHERDAQSHDIAKRVRPALAEIAKQFNARVAVAEVPPGPPVLQTLVAEIYGPTEEHRLAMANEVRTIFNNARGVVDVDWYIEAEQPKFRIAVDKEKSALHDITTAAVAQTLQLAVSGLPAGLMHQPSEKEDLPLVLELPRSRRADINDLLALRLAPENPSSSDRLVPLRELVRVDEQHVERSIYHKNLLPVTYVIADVAGEVESPAYAIFEMNRALKQLDAREYGGATARLGILNSNMPFTDLEPALKWDGEWHITIEVFRDLGLAFAAVLILIYALMVGWFGSFITPLIVMAAIPFSLIGILPAHGFAGAFFTATSMIGFMAGAGIVVRNSIILVDFIEQRLREGLPLADAVIDAGAVRFRPMLLTALAVVVGSAVILFDPIFQGLAISLMAGEIASLFVSRMAVPILYYMRGNAPAK